MENPKKGVTDGSTMGVSSVTIPATVVHGTVTITPVNTQNVLGALTTLLIGVTVKARAANTGIVYVGIKDGVNAAQGFPLAAGEQIFLPVSQLNNIWVSAATNNDVVSYIGN